jgi:hypothetical protein
MEHDASPALSSSAHVVGIKSWLAYFGLLVQAAVLLLLFAGLRMAPMVDDAIAAAVLAVAALAVAYQFLMIRSVQLYYDDIGVWAFSGVLPWKKGVVGVKWRDMDEASFEPGFWSWVTGSYTVHIRHRFTKASEIVLTNIANGKHAASVLSARHQEMIRAGIID